MADKFADEIVELSDMATPRDAHVRRLQVDSRKWIASKLLPRVYGMSPPKGCVCFNGECDLQTSCRDGKCPEIG
jgi:hypothetical protein